MIGIAYKRDINDVRESPALGIMEELAAKGAIVDYHDSYIPRIETAIGTMDSVDLDQGLRDCDLALIVTDHQYIDYGRIVELAPIVVDTRNATKGIETSPNKVYRL